MRHPAGPARLAGLDVRGRLLLRAHQRVGELTSLKVHGWSSIAVLGHCNLHLPTTMLQDTEDTEDTESLVQQPQQSPCEGEVQQPPRLQQRLQQRHQPASAGEQGEQQQVEQATSAGGTPPAVSLF